MSGRFGLHRTDSSSFHSAGKFPDAVESLFRQRKPGRASAFAILRRSSLLQIDQRLKREPAVYSVQRHYSQCLAAANTERSGRQHQG